MATFYFMEAVYLPHSDTNKKRQITFTANSNELSLISLTSCLSHQTY